METPPPFNPQPSYAPPPPKKSKPGLIIGIVVVAILFCCGGPLLLGGLGGWWAFNKIGPFVTCAISMSETKKAILAYEKENGHFPPAATWQSDIAPFYTKIVDSAKSKNDRGPFKTWNIDESLVCTTEPSPTGVAYNEDLAGKKLSDIKDPYTTYLLFEVPQTGMNLHEKYTHRSESTYPKLMDKKRPWLEEPVSGKLTGGDSNTMRISTDADSDGDEDTSPPAKEDAPTPPAKKGAKDGGDAGVAGNGATNGKKGADNNGDDGV